MGQKGIINQQIVGEKRGVFKGASKKNKLQQQIEKKCEKLKILCIMMLCGS